MWSSNQAALHLPRGVENLCSHKNLNYSSFIHTCQNLETTKMSFSKWTDGQTGTSRQWNNCVQKNCDIEPEKDTKEPWMHMTHWKRPIWEPTRYMIPAVWHSGKGKTLRQHKTSGCQRPRRARWVVRAEGSSAAGLLCVMHIGHSHRTHTPKGEPRVGCTLPVMCRCAFSSNEAPLVRDGEGCVCSVLHSILLWTWKCFKKGKGLWPAWCQQIKWNGQIPWKKQITQLL